MNKIKKLRKEKKLTLDDLAKLTNIKRGTLNNYENSKTEPKLSTWEKLANLFQVSVPYIQGLGLQDQDKKNIIFEVTFRYFLTNETTALPFSNDQLNFYQEFSFFLSQKKINWDNLFNLLTDISDNENKAFNEFKKLMFPYIDGMFSEVVSFSYRIGKPAFYDDYDTDEASEAIIIKGAIDTLRHLYNDQTTKPDYVKLSDIALDIENQIGKLNINNINPESDVNKESIISKVKEDIKRAYGLLHSIENTLK